LGSMPMQHGYGQGGGPQGGQHVVQLGRSIVLQPKPFYMVLSKCKKVTWEPITKKVWSSALKSNVNFTFLRWSLSHYYNYQMNDNDIADQLRLVYLIMHFQRNNKWWWALFIWGYNFQW
jgi:hypothetical protein